MDIRDKNIKIHSFMISDLNLGGDELIAYALIYNHVEQGMEMILNNEEFCLWLNCSEENALAILWQLLDKELIVMREKELHESKLITLDIL